MSHHAALGPGREFDRIRDILDRLGQAAADSGDDCAVLPPGTGRVVVSVDAAVENVHFRREWLAPDEIGWRATAGGLSDLAAAGADVVGVLVALAVPDEGDLAESIMAGAGEAVAATGGKVLGGDLTRAAGVVVSVTAIGRARIPMRRSGGRAGDGLWVTGTLGGARAALGAWEAGEEPDAAARQAFARPAPRIAAGRSLASLGARAMMDLSDGLAGDVRHLAAASRAGAHVELERLPVHASVAEAARRDGEPAVVFAARGGEDYELLVAMPGEFGEADAGRFTDVVGVPLTRIGHLDGTGTVSLVLEGRPVEASGFDHFA